jgi:hypothetical protein
MTETLGFACRSPRYLVLQSFIQKGKRIKN